MNNGRKIHTYSEVLRKINTINPQRKIAVISNIPLEPLFTDNLIFYASDWQPYTLNVYEQDEQDADVAIVYLDLKQLFPEFFDKYYLMSKAERRHKFDSMREWMAEYLRQKHYLSIMFFSFLEDNTEPACRRWQTINDIVRQANIYLNEFAEERDDVWIIDINHIFAQVGSTRALSNRLNAAVGLTFSFEMLQLMARECCHVLQAMYGRQTKCLITDCDDVLWGGIAAEDGIEGIVIASEGAGLAYREYQQELLRLFGQGVILCICSKGDETIICNILNNHPNMLLRKEYITTIRAGSQNKADSILSIAVELNILLDNIVFVDDSKYEIGLVNSELPQVKTIWLDRDNPFNYKDTIQNAGIYLRHSYTDGMTRQLYHKQQIERNKLKERVIDIEKYNRMLNPQIHINTLAETDVKRLAEFTNRCHQFNLSNRHYSVAQLMHLMSDESYEILTMHAEDILGDMGLVGAAFIRYSDQRAIIEAFYLSCRVFGRDFEDMLLNGVKKKVQSREITLVEGVYNRSTKNTKFHDFYILRGVRLHNEL